MVGKTPNLENSVRREEAHRMKQVKGPPPLWLLPNGHAQRPAEPVRCRESFDGSPAQHDIDPEKHQLQLGLRQLSDPLGEARPVERNELRDVRDRIFRQTSRLRGEGTLPGLLPNADCWLAVRKRPWRCDSG